MYRNPDLAWFDDDQTFTLDPMVGRELDEMSKVPENRHRFFESWQIKRADKNGLILRAVRGDDVAVYRVKSDPHVTVKWGNATRLLEETV